MTPAGKPGDERYDLIVIGAGPGGMAAAREAARLGGYVALVEADHVGGRANWHSLLPSKVWLTAADRRGARQRDGDLGLNPATGAVFASAVVGRIAALKQIRGGSYREELDQLGVRLIDGHAAFIDPHTLQLGGRHLAADRFIIATGSVPIFFPELKPDGELVIAPRHMSKFDTIPESIVVAGGGVTGTEFVYLFNRIGSQVTWLVGQSGVLPRSDRDIVAGLVTILQQRGVQLIEGVATRSLSSDGRQVTARLQDGRTFAAGAGFIAVGRRPDTGELNLEAAGVETAPSGAVLTNSHQQSTAPHIYAVGDAAGAPMLANRAMAQGRIAAHHALNQPVVFFRPDTVLEAVYSDPQVAQVGLTEAAARAGGQPLGIVKVGFERNLKARLLDETEGFLKLLYDPDDGRLLGAGAVGGHAAEVIAPLGVALAQNASIEELAMVYAGYPTLSELALEGARLA
jgi:pyruvate/2-oxoglutarate dehydrogenase complex dihydrolipoamide dehydrogenase (E3) component